MFLEAPFVDIKPRFNQGKRSHRDRYRIIYKLVIDHDENKINDLN